MCMPKPGIETNWRYIGVIASVLPTQYNASEINLRQFCTVYTNEEENNSLFMPTNYSLAKSIKYTIYIYIHLSFTSYTMKQNSVFIFN